MIVAIQDGLEKLGRELLRYNIKAVKYNEYSYPIDAFLYEGEYMPDSSITSALAQSERGIFIVNVRGLNADEVATILQRRTYTPLF